MHRRSRRLRDLIEARTTRVSSFPGWRVEDLVSGIRLRRFLYQALLPAGQTGQRMASRISLRARTRSLREYAVTHSSSTGKIANFSIIFAMRINVLALDD